MTSFFTYFRIFLLFSYFFSSKTDGMNFLLFQSHSTYNHTSVKPKFLSNPSCLCNFYYEYANMQQTDSYCKWPQQHFPHIHSKPAHSHYITVIVLDWMTCSRNARCPDFLWTERCQDNSGDIVTTVRYHTAVYSQCVEPQKKAKRMLDWLWFCVKGTIHL